MSKIITPNLLSRPHITITPRGNGLSPSGMEGEKLKTEEPSEKAVVTTVTPFSAGWVIRATNGPIDINSFALVNTNLSGHGLWRLTSPPQTTQITIPNAITSSSNMTGNVSRIENDIDLPDGNLLTPTNTLNSWFVETTMTNIGVTPKTGLGMAVVGIRIQLVGDALTVYPKVTLEIIDGVTTVNMGSRAVSKNAIDPGFIFLFPFDPIGFSSIYTLKFKVTGYPGDNGSYAEYESINVIFEDTLDTYFFDTGYQQSPFEVFGKDIDGPYPTKSINYLFDTVQSNITEMDLMFIDDQAQLDLYDATLLGFPNSVTLNTVTMEPDTYIEAGCISAGLTVDGVLIYGSGEPSSKPLITLAGGTTQAGQTYAVDAFIRRGTDTVNLYMTRFNAMQLMIQIGWKKGQVGPTFIILEESLPVEYQLLTSYWATVNNMKMFYVTDLERNANTPASDICVVSFDMEEKL